MTSAKINPSRKKKIKALLAMMNKQNKRLIPVVPPLVEMMDMVVTDSELDYLVQLETGTYDFDQAFSLSNMAEDEFYGFLDSLQRKGFIHGQEDSRGNTEYRLNAIAVGWYECMMHYLMGKPNEKEFSQKFNEVFEYFKKFNFFPLRNIQNLILPALLDANQDTEIIDPKIEGKNKRRVIPLNKDVSVPNQRVYPTSYVNELIEKFGEKDQIYVFPCVCRHAKTLTDSECQFDIPRESCIGLGKIVTPWVDWGYGRKVSKEEAMEILKDVREHGAVHSVIHDRDDYHLPIIAICNCCWDCCGMLKPYNMGAISLKYNVSFTARIKQNADCKGCGICEKFCPTTAIRLKNDKVTLNPDRCIGCGQCAFQCRQNNIELYPNKRKVYLPLLNPSEIRVTH